MNHGLSLLALLALAPLSGGEPPASPTLGGRLEPANQLITRTLTLTPRMGEKATSLGANVSSVAPALADQLKLPAGVGLVVDSVDSGSPAEAAGIKAHDVLHRLADQLLMNPAQLTALIRAAKPGDSAVLSVIRQGAPVTLTANLVAKELPADFIVFTGAIGEQAMALQQGMAQSIPARRMILRNMNGKQTTEWVDAKHIVLVVRENNTTVTATIRDARSGKSLFEGPAQTPEQRKAMPPELLKKLEQAEQIPLPAMEPFRVWQGEAVMAPGGMVARGRVLTWSNADHLFVMRVMGPAQQPTPTYLLALSKKDGKTIFDGPVMTDKQKQGMPAEIAEQFQTLVSHPETAKEFGGK